jgi:uncharacterized protein YyaL (SSP411 family)
VSAVPNRLARERSPYLLQHALNPVDWYAWGDEAFEAARREAKPIFLSIGYSTCHWCHVMEHESFEDAAVADALNRDFISIKVDREERPDVDRVYMTFVQATTGAGGWPMSVFLTPDLKPFFGGTYFPPTTRWGRPGFIEILEQISRTWRTDRPRVLTSAETMTERLREATGANAPAPDRAPVAAASALDLGVRAFADAFDARHGGFGGAPKFPRPSELFCLLQTFALTGAHDARRMALETLRAMALGGIRDHVGGGFHRYSVDAEWRVPHFEKMLYDQAQLTLVYLEAAQASGDPFYAAVAEDTLEYVAREMTADDGGIWSAEDADSRVPGGTEKREGAFFVWTAQEIDALFGADAPVVRRRFGVENGGNALADPQGEFEGQNILYVAQTVEDVAARTGREIGDVMAILARARRVLFDARQSRPRPHLDDKVITAWNGLMIAAFARAARTLPSSPARERWRSAAQRAAASVRTRLWRADERRLLRRYRDGDAAVEAFCEDYACLIWGLLELFQADGDVAWLNWAIELQAVQTEKFFDQGDGGWFTTTGEDPSVLLRLKEDHDGAEPSGASVTVLNLLTLAHLLGDVSLRDRAGRALERYGPQIGRVARVMPFMLANIAHWHGPASEIVIVSETGAEALPLASVVSCHYLPCAVQIPVRPGESQRALAATLPWVAAMTKKDGSAAAYVCRDFACQRPTTDPDELDRQLSIAGPTRIILA